MMNSEIPSLQGEQTTHSMDATWIDPHPIEKGEFIALAKIETALANEFATLYLMISDLNDSSISLQEALKHGLPNDKNTVAKALIYSAIVAYMRCFNTGKRESLKAEEIALQLKEFNTKIHEYLKDVRNKHISHSVNTFEDCTTVALMVITPSGESRYNGGIGVVNHKFVGISITQIEQAIIHIEAIKKFLTNSLEEKRLQLHSQFKDQFAKDSKLEMAPLAKLIDRDNVATAR